jgi:uncharacterized tellurite resistance protein B-like protein
VTTPYNGGMDIGTRQKICQLVAGIIIADDILDEKEEAFVDRLIKSFEVGESGRDVIFPLVDRNEAAAQIKDLPKEAQEAALTLLIEAACVDSQIAPEEREYLKAIADALEIPDTTLAKRVAEQLGTVSQTG